MKTWCMLAIAAALSLGVSVGSADADDGAEFDGGMRVLTLLSDLDLSAEQRASAAMILRDHRPELRSSVDALLAARGELFEAIHRPVVEESMIRAASQRVAKIEEEFAVKRASVIGSLRALLSAEQTELLQKVKVNAHERMLVRAARIRQLLDRWIDRNADG